MDDTQRAAFARDGYIIIPNAVPPAQLAALNAEYDAHLSMPSDFSHICCERIVQLPIQLYAAILSQRT